MFHFGLIRIIYRVLHDTIFIKLQNQHIQYGVFAVANEIRYLCNDTQVK